MKARAFFVGLQRPGSSRSKLESSIENSRKIHRFASVRENPDTGLHVEFDLDCAQTTIRLGFCGDEYVRSQKQSIKAVLTAYHAPFRRFRISLECFNR